MKRPDMDVTEKELVDHCAKKLARYEIPRVSFSWMRCPRQR
ncbi:MAG: hypothetical protein U0694_02160 [Anaerolineae bacterium]